MRPRRRFVTGVRIKCPECDHHGPHVCPADIHYVAPCYADNPGRMVWKPSLDSRLIPAVPPAVPAVHRCRRCAIGLDPKGRRPVVYHALPSDMGREVPIVCSQCLTEAEGFTAVQAHQCSHCRGFIPYGTGYSFRGVCCNACLPGQRAKLPSALPMPLALQVGDHWNRQAEREAYEDMNELLAGREDDEELPF